jgi:hypothetical protein
MFYLRRLPSCLALACAVLAFGTALDPALASPRSSSRHKTTARIVCTTVRPAKHRKAKKTSRARAAEKCVSTKARKRVVPKRATGSGKLEATPIGSGVLSPEAEAPAKPAREKAGAEPRSRSPLPGDSGETVTDPIDSRFLTYAPFGTTSFWVQPWRAYLDTWSSSRLLNGAGINFNVNIKFAEPAAQLLQESGFKLARIAVDWSSISYENPNQLNPGRLQSLDERLTALHNHGLRPLIVLQAYTDNPAPAKHVVLETTAEAPAGARTVQLSPASASLVVPDKTGFNALAFGAYPDVLITSVSPAGVATLIKPLPNALPAGGHGGTTLLYSPFTSPTLANGEPNPQFQETMSGWLDYVGAVSKAAASIVGPGGFDLEVWNEITFGSKFLNLENYEAVGARSEARSQAQTQTQERQAEPESAATAEKVAEEDEINFQHGPEADYGSEAAEPTEAEEAPETERAGVEGEEAIEAQAIRQNSVPKIRLVKKAVMRAVLKETVEYVRNPANGISPEVGISDGFASETPFPSGASAPVGLTALSKAPYVGGRVYPASYREDNDVPLSAQGTRDTLKGSFAPLFTPSYQTDFPEFMLSDLSTETLVRDVAPMTTDVYHFPHGRSVGPVGGAPVQKWVTEYNLGQGHSTVVGPDGVTPAEGPASVMSAADQVHFHAKALLRSLVAMINKGIGREYFFGTGGNGPFSMVSSTFFSDLESNPGTYPGRQAGGEIMAGFHNLLARFEGPGPSGEARQLKLLSITQEGNHAQFTGDGTEAHPNLYDRDVLAVLPFQSSPTHFVIPVYVMTTDLLTLYQPNASPSDVTRFDLPDENFRITLGNLPASQTPPTVSAFDPLRNTNTPARLVSREGETAVFEFAATDYPRLLSIEYNGA